MYWNKLVKGLNPYVPGEQPQDKRYIKLNTNENPYPPSPNVIEVIKKTADAGLRLYPDPEAVGLRKAVAKKFGLGIDEVFVGNGSDEILAFAFGAFFESGGAPMLFPDISYSFYPVYAGLWGLPYKTIPLSEDFALRPEDYSIPSGGIIFPNPNAPTGVALSLDQLLFIAEYQLKQEKPLIIDEAYVDFGAASFVDHIGDFPNLLVVHTMSKARSLAGLRVGYALGNAGLIEALNRIKNSFNSYTVDRLALAAGAAALEDDTYYTGINRRVAATRERVMRELEKTGFKLTPSKANFIFAKFPGLGGHELYQAFKECGILVRYFNKERISDYLRISIGSDEDMDIFLKVSKEIIK